jgi:hypothetical protein
MSHRRHIWTSDDRMNRDTARYVLQLRDRVTPRQRNVLLALACYHQMARETYWPTRARLATELSMDESQLRRIIRELEQAGILKHISGIGAGNRSGFIFVELEKGDAKGDKKGDFFDPVIRNYKTFTEPLQEQKPPAFDSDLAQSQKKSKEGEGKTPPPIQRCTQSDFDERDLRSLATAYRKFDKMREASVGAGAHWTDEKFYGWLSLESGLTPRRIREIEKAVGWATSKPNSAVNEAGCVKHPTSVLTRWGTCAECYAERNGAELKKEPQRVAG